jgi:hypothetical protein
MNYAAMLLLTAALTCSSNGYTKCSQRPAFNNKYPGVRKAPVATRGRGKAASYGGGPKVVVNPFVGEEVLPQSPRPLVTPKAARKSKRITFSNGTVLIVSPEFTGIPMREHYMAEGQSMLSN